MQYVFCNSYGKSNSLNFAEFAGKSNLLNFAEFHGRIICWFSRRICIWWICRFCRVQWRLRLTDILDVSCSLWLSMLLLLLFLTARSQGGRPRFPVSARPACFRRTSLHHCNNLTEVYTLDLIYDICRVCNILHSFAEFCRISQNL